MSVILLFPLSLQSKPFLFNLVLAFLVHYGDEYFLDIAVDRTLPCGFDLFSYELFDLQLCLLDNHLLQYVVLVHFLQFLSEHIVLVGQYIHVSKGRGEEISGDVLFCLLNKLGFDVGSDTLFNFVTLN